MDPKAQHALDRLNQEGRLTIVEPKEEDDKYYYNVVDLYYFPNSGNYYLQTYTNSKYSEPNLRRISGESEVLKIIEKHIDWL